MYMDENIVKQKIQKAFPEPRAPKGLIQQVILRVKAVAMGGNVAQRFNSGERLQQITGQKPVVEQTTNEIPAPKTEDPATG